MEKKSLPENCPNQTNENDKENSMIQGVVVVVICVQTLQLVSNDEQYQYPS
jgi:hypothetical protein